MKASMIPFKVFDRKKKITWLVLNYQETKDGGKYLAAMENDSTDKDGNLHLIDAAELTNYRLIGFVDMTGD